MSFDIQDDYLTSSELTWVRGGLSRDFPWFFCDHLNDKSSDKSILGNYYFNHTLIERGQVLSQEYIIVFQPLIERLNIRLDDIMRMKVNLYPRTQIKVHHRSHTDYQPESGYTALFYLNTNNGLTVVDGKKKIKSVENRMLFFDGSQKHHSTTCTNKNSRITINFSIWH
jgi:hypothetical protein